ncbi:MAG: twin transmembrane helix small protein [Alphaproteobacteria bacterium]|nr:twin transmembrane helix small protein [Alphaproteobacteria bacterium]
MPTFLNHTATAVAFLVFLVLVGGLVNLLRSNSANMSQTLMRWRVGLQFVAIVLVVLSAWIAKSA